MRNSIILPIITFFTLTSLVLSQDNNYVQGEVIVMVKNNSDLPEIFNSFGSINLKMKEPLVEYMNIWLLEYDFSKIQPDIFLFHLRKNPKVLIAQFNHYVYERTISTTFPNDTRFSEQWSLHNTGQTGGTPDADIDAPEAWDITTGGLTALGDSIIIAIVDGGFYLNHLDVKFWKNYAEIPNNNIDDDNNGYIDDYLGWNAFTNSGNVTASGTHGTHVSGSAGAIGNNNLGVCGVNWNAKIMAVQGSSGNEATVVRAYGYVLKQRKIYNQTNGTQGAFVVSTNSSFGVDYGQPSNYPLWCAFYDSLGSAGILNACATANLNVNVDVVGDIPTACPSPWMVSVTNTTHNDVKYTSAGYGLVTIDLGAPGTSILSSTSASNYGLSTGTSMATPHVAGAIALMYAAASSQFIQAYKNDPDSISLLVKSKLLQGVDVIPSLQNVTVSGGRLNIKNSLILIQNITSAGNTSGLIPEIYQLYQNYPNPFNPSTVINFEIPKTSFVTLKIYDALGKEVITLLSGEVSAGSHQISVDGNNLTSGIYFYKLVSENFSDTKKMLLIK